MRLVIKTVLIVLTSLVFVVNASMDFNHQIINVFVNKETMRQLMV